MRNFVRFIASAFLNGLGLIAVILMALVVIALMAILVDGALDSSAEVSTVVRVLCGLGIVLLLGLAIKLGDLPASLSQTHTNDEDQHDGDNELKPCNGAPEPLSNPSQQWCDDYADWYEGQRSDTRAAEPRGDKFASSSHADDDKRAIETAFSQSSITLENGKQRDELLREAMKFCQEYQNICNRNRMGPYSLLDNFLERARALKLLEG